MTNVVDKTPLINFAQLLMESETSFLDRYEWKECSSFTSKLNTKCVLSVSVM